jgi:hypothetical protein
MLPPDTKSLVFDPVMECLLWDYMREVLIIVMMLVVLMWAALPLYWGSLAPGLSHAPNFKAWVVDFDGGPLGAFVTESVINSTKVRSLEELKNVADVSLTKLGRKQAS